MHLNTSYSYYIFGRRHKWIYENDCSVICCKNPAALAYTWKAICNPYWKAGLMRCIRLLILYYFWMLCAYCTVSFDGSPIKPLRMTWPKKRTEPGQTLRCTISDSLCTNYWIVSISKLLKKYRREGNGTIYVKVREEPAIWNQYNWVDIFKIQKIKGVV